MSGRSLEDTVVGDYLIRDFIASGGMGEVYHAWHLNKQTPAAIKILQMDATRDPRTKERFSREVNALKRLWHSHIVRLYEFGELSDGRMYMIMEYVDGGTLYDEWTNYYDLGEYMPTDRVVYTMHKVSVAMAHAHEQGVIHRDLKPSNILVRANGEPVVTDLGIAAMAGVNPMTGTLDSLGTPIYMAPEQLTTGGQIDARVDIYAIGVMMYELLTGRRPYEAENNWSLINAKLNYDPVPLYEYRPDIPWHIRQVVSRCLQLDPEYRHASSELLAEDLRTILAGKTPPPALITRREPPPPPQFVPQDPEPEPENRFHYPPIPRPELAELEDEKEPEPLYTPVEPTEVEPTEPIKKERPARVQVQAQYRPREIRPAVESVEPLPPSPLSPSSPPTPPPVRPDPVPFSRREPTQPVVLERTIIEQNEPPHDPRLDIDPPPFRPKPRPVREPGMFESFILRLLNGVSSPEPMGAKLLVPLAIVALALIMVVGLGMTRLFTGVQESIEQTIPAEVAADVSITELPNELPTDLPDGGTSAFVPADEPDEPTESTKTPHSVPTETPLPDDRNTPRPTVTPLPTATPAPTVSDTPEPIASDTPEPESSRTPRPTRTRRPTFTPTSTLKTEPTSMIAVTVPTDVEDERVEAVIVSDTITADVEETETVEPDETPVLEETATPLSISTITPTVAVDSEALDATATTLARFAEATQEAEATATREAAEREYAVGATATARHYNQIATQTQEALEAEWKVTETARAVPPDPIVINRAGQCLNVPFGGQVEGMTWTWRGTLKAGQSFSIVVGAPNSTPSNVRRTGITAGWGGTFNNGAWQASPFNHQLVRGNYSWTVWLVENGQTLVKAQNRGCLNVN